MNKRNKIILIILVVLFIGGFAFAYGNSELFQGRMFTFSKPLPVYNENRCYDSDGGKNYKEKGTIYGKISRSNFGNKTDVCITRTKLREYYCNGKFIQSEEYNCESGCSAGACKFALKSDFLKNSSEAKAILLGEKYDMDELGLLTGETDINKDVFAYKLFSVFKMLGYRTDRGYNIDGNKPHILVLNQFQSENGFPESSFINKEILLKLDSKLYEKEQFVKEFAGDFPLYEYIGNLHVNDISKDHWAYLHYYPMTVLPDGIQLKTVPQYVHCFSTQCGSFVLDGYSTDFLEPGNFILYHEALSPPTGGFGMLLSDDSMVHTFLHEYAHYIDSTLEGPYEPMSGSGLLDTAGFYEISHDKVGNCYKEKPSMTIYDYISDYATSQSVYSSDCSPETYLYAEDFAESFASYVTDGKDFRSAAQNSSVLLQKYNWLKTNVFEGIEYNTSVSHGNASGCNDLPGLSYQTPGYLKCDEEYVWDGKLSEL